MVTVCLCVRLIAAPGKETEVAAFLETALPLVEAEPDTTAWFAARIDSSTFLIFDVFPNESGREQHLAGPVAAALAARAEELFAESGVSGAQIRPSRCPGVFVDQSAKPVAAVELI
jgi:quinol monooxygenase YgiN